MFIDEVCKLLLEATLELTILHKFLWSKLPFSQERGNVDKIGKFWSLFRIITNAIYGISHCRLDLFENIFSRICYQYSRLGIWIRLGHFLSWFDQGFNSFCRSLM